MKKILLMIAVVVLVAPFFISAQSIPVTDKFTPTQTACTDLQYNTSYRSRDAKTNGEVSDLQDFLISQRYLSGEPTGYFGAATLTAVKRFQSTVGLGSAGSLGYGGVGPKTRAKIKAMTCGSSSSTLQPVPQQTSPTISATKTSSSCVTPHITSLPSSIFVTVGQSAVQVLTSDQLVTFSLLNSPWEWVSVSENKINFINPAALGTYKLNIVATNSCGAKDIQTIPVVVTTAVRAQIPTVEPVQQPNNLPVVTIDQSSLISMTGNITITGTAANLASKTLLFDIEKKIGNPLLYSTFGFGFGNGHWSLKLQNAPSVGCPAPTPGTDLFHYQCPSNPTPSSIFSPGNYKINIYNNDANGTSGVALASGILIVK